MARKPSKGKSLAELKPKLVKQWHSTKNGDLTPFDVSAGSSKKVWWKCPEGDDHEWVATIKSRTRGSGCAVCAGRVVVHSNCLATLCPELKKEWHTIKNGDLTPFDVSTQTAKKVWWKCNEGDDHEWEASIDNRVNGAGCLICAGKVVVLSNCLDTIYPDLSKQWHPIKNKSLTPFTIHAGSHTKVWWKCEKGDDHEWIASPNGRRDHGCPVCANKKVVLSNCLATTNPELKKEWHPTKNGDLTPFDVTAGSSKKVWWKCPEGDDHIWDANISWRKEEGCPICSGHRTVFSTSIANTHPQIISQWHPTKNGDLTPSDVSAGSSKKVWWKCPEGDDHEYQQIIKDKVRGVGCPICSGHMVVTSNSLAITHPKLAKQWHKIKNGNITPSDVHAGSHSKAWWQCDKGEDHIWQSVIKSRTDRGDGCSICRGLTVVSSNCLATLNPKLANQWHPTKNGDLTANDVSENSGKKVWWKCKNGEDHEWRISIANRSSGSNCPFCDLTPQSKQELTITFELIKFFKDINPKGFKTRVKGKLWSIDIYIPQLKLGIEFDGSYWHKDKRTLDKLKTEQLEEDGFEIFRVRQEPLKRIFDDDIMSKQPFNAKQVTNDILTQIMSRYNLDAKKIIKIESYIAKKELQNEKGLDKYIDMILTEKAEKKA